MSDTTVIGAVPVKATASKIENQKWREYVLDGKPYRIENPVTLYTAFGVEHHQIKDSDGVIHYVSDGAKSILRYMPLDPNAPVTF